MSISPLSPSIGARLDQTLVALADELIRFRRDLHQNPELSWSEHRTASQIEAKLASWGITSLRAIGTAVIVDIPGKADLPKVIYRGDIDALPIVDTKDPDVIAYASQNAGQCHACGHDVHATIALAVSKAIIDAQDELVAPVRIIFQPAEEVLPSGADALAKAGELSGASIGLALHVDPSRDVGTVAWRTGAITSATDTFEITVRGRAGHSARPHLANDAIGAAAQITLAVHGLSRQAINPLHTAVLSVGEIHAGSAPNVIAGSALLRGTCRTMNLEDRIPLHDALREKASAAAAMHGCTAETKLALGAPPVRNDEELAALVREHSIELLGEENVAFLEWPSTGAEDFGVFSDWMRTFMLRLGCGVPSQPRLHLHEEGFDLDEGAILIGARIMARSVIAASKAAVR